MVEFDELPKRDKDTLTSLLALSKHQIRRKMYELSLTDEQFFDFISVLEQFNVKPSKKVRVVKYAIYAGVTIVAIFLLVHFFLHFLRA